VALPSEAGSLVSVLDAHANRDTRLRPRTDESAGAEHTHHLKPESDSKGPPNTRISARPSIGRQSPGLRNVPKHNLSRMTCQDLPA